jgi:hypothetical protein
MNEREKENRTVKERSDGAEERLDSLLESLLELLLLEQSGDLSAQQEGELERLLARLEQEGEEGGFDADGLRLAIAAAGNAAQLEAGESSSPPMPAGLEARLREDAERFFAGVAPAEDAATVSEGNVRPLRPRRSPPAVVRDKSARSAAGAPWLGWAVAASLALALAWTQWRAGVPAVDPETIDGQDRVASSTAPEQAGPAPLADRYRQLAAESDSVVTPWSLPSDPEFAAVRGEVLWNDRLQAGFLRFEGMPVNDPLRRQYQLWIVDPVRDSRPVDGGVFDIAAADEVVIVPIRAKLAVDNPQLFAVTREKPGGVVVSEGPLLLLARPG